MSRVKAEQFVRVWIEAIDNGESISWIANTLKVSDVTVHKLAANLRTNGVDLPKIRRPFVEPVKVDQLNDLIRSKFDAAS